MAITLTNPMSGDQFKTELENALDKRGDSMATGKTLSMGKNPTSDMECATKKYVDESWQMIEITKIGTTNTTVSGESAVKVGQIPNFVKDNAVFMWLDRYNSHWTVHIEKYSSTGFDFKLCENESTRIKIDDEGYIYFYATSGNISVNIPFKLFYTHMKITTISND